MTSGNQNLDGTEDFQVPLLNVFRSAAKAHDEAVGDAVIVGQDRQVSTRQIERREGIGYDRLKDYFLEDLGNLMSTVHLEAVENLNDYPNVRKSILNYGVLDASQLSEQEAARDDVRKRFRQALLDHEPRLIPDTVVVKPRDAAQAIHAIAFEVEAILAARPVDVPLEFVAEIDVGSGRVFATDVSVQE